VTSVRLQVNASLKNKCSFLRWFVTLKNCWYRHPTVSGYYILNTDEILYLGMGGKEFVLKCGRTRSLMGPLWTLRRQWLDNITGYFWEFLVGMWIVVGSDSE
jgi:hypothetical protein